MLSDLELGHTFNDLDLCYWKTADELRERLLERMQRHLGLAGPNDVAGFNRVLGIDERGWVKLDSPDGVEAF